MSKFATEPEDLHDVTSAEEGRRRARERLEREIAELEKATNEPRKDCNPS